ncbi:hypothetical protein MRX96_043744 [Rhipicephalus microplus]
MKSNAKSATAARYKKEWIYDCLLLKIKSTAVYTFLHENKFLPLPNPRTLYGYLRNLKADFGFDSTLFTVLCEKLEAVPERERRGVLMFDEMSVRKKRPHSRVGHGTAGQGGFRRTHTTRNNLLKVGKFLLPQGQEVFHCHYKDLLDYEEERAGLRAVPKLTKAHIFPNAFQKMSVKLAVQLFSESTASAMEFYSEQEDCKKLHGIGCNIAIHKNIEQAVRLPELSEARPCSIQRSTTHCCVEGQHCMAGQLGEIHQDITDPEASLLSE